MKERGKIEILDTNVAQLVIYLKIFSEIGKAGGVSPHNLIEIFSKLNTLIPEENRQERDEKFTGEFNSFMISNSKERILKYNNKTDRYSLTHKAEKLIASTSQNLEKFLTVCPQNPV